MKRVVSIVLAVMLLTTGCSLIGHKDDINGSEPIIPAVVQDEDGSDNIIGTADESTQNVNNNAEASAATTSPGENTGLSSGVTSSELFIDNGAGDGVVTNPSDKNSLLITLYYRNKGGLLIPVTRKAAKQEGLAKAAVNGLVDEAVTREQLDYYGLYPVLPKGTKIKGMSIKNQLAVIDFSKEFSSFASKSDEQTAIASVVYTLTGFKTISDVSIRIEGKQVDHLSNGTNLSEVRNRNNTFINSDEVVLKDGYVKYDAYFLANENDKFNYLVPISLQLEDVEQSQIPVSLFFAMSKDPSNTKTFTSIPNDTKLLSFEKQDNIAILDFSSQINNSGGSAKENSMLNQIYYSINQIKGIDKVKILIDGKESTISEGTEVSVAKAIPATFNKVIEE